MSRPVRSAVSEPARPPRPWRGLGALAAALAFLVAGAGEAAAASSGLTTAQPLVRHPTAGQRVALLIVPGPAQTDARQITAHADEEAYRRHLREIGFEVWTIGPSSRPDLDRLLRDAAARLPVGADVLVLALGTALSTAGDVFLVPADTRTGETRPEMLDTEAVRLSTLLRRLAARAPRHLAAIVDECRPVSAPGRCAVEAAGASGASVLAARRTHPGGEGPPRASRSSLREDLLAAMTIEGQSFIQLYHALAARLSGSDLALDTTGSLSAGFALLPANFFAELPHECNRVDADADPATLRHAGLEAVLRACESAAATWPYARPYAEKLAIAREQRAFQRAVASCDDRFAASAFTSAYPSSRLRRVIDDHFAACERTATNIHIQAEIRRERDKASAAAAAAAAARDQAASAASAAAAARDQANAAVAGAAGRDQLAAGTTEAREYAAHAATAANLARDQATAAATAAAGSMDQASAAGAARDLATATGAATGATRSRDQAAAAAAAAVAARDQALSAAAGAVRSASRVQAPVQTPPVVVTPPAPPPQPPPQAARATASSRAGWSLQYSGDLLTISPESNDLHDTDKNTYTTVWHSRRHGKDVVIYVQVSENSQCRGAQRYATEQIASRRGSVSRSEDISAGNTVRSGYIIEGRGFRTSGGSVDDRGFVDFVTLRRSDPSTIVHVGGRFPREHADLYRGEILNMIRSLQLPARDAFTGICSR